MTLQVSLSSYQTQFLRVPTQSIVYLLSPIALFLLLRFRYKRVQLVRVWGLQVCVMVQGILGFSVQGPCLRGARGTVGTFGMNKGITTVVIQMHANHDADRTL